MSDITSMWDTDKIHLTHTSVTHIQNVITWPTMLDMMSFLEHTHHVFLVFLEMSVDKEASSSITKRFIDKVNTLIPARGQRGGSLGNLEVVWETERKGNIDSFATWHLLSLVQSQHLNSLLTGWDMLGLILEQNKRFISSFFSFKPCYKVHWSSLSRLVLKIN